MRTHHAGLAMALALALALGTLGCTAGVKSAILFGADRNGARVTHPATSFSVANGPIYFEVDSPKKFGGTSMVIQVLQRASGAEKIVDSATVQVPADDNVYSLPLTPSVYGPGDYRLAASINGDSVASGTVTFTP